MAPRKNKGKEKVDEVSSSFSANCSVEESDVLLEVDVPPGAKLLKDCEAALLLRQFYNDNEDIFRKNRIEMTETFKSAFQYANEAVHYSNIDYVNEELGRLRDYGATDEEKCMLGNTCPNTIEEAFALIPSLKEKIEWIVPPLKKVLAKIGYLKVTKK